MPGFWIKSELGATVLVFGCAVVPFFHDFGNVLAMIWLVE